MNRDVTAQRIAMLSRREQEILTLLADGHSDAEIAQVLALQVSTVKWYNRQIFNKLSVSNRREAVRLAQRKWMARPSYHLPAPPTRLVGREQETSALCRLLSEARLVTVLAPGGMGKTRLALAAAERLAERFSDGICFVPLAATLADRPLDDAIANALELSLQRDLPARMQLLAFLRNKSLLLVLDNFEHLLDQALLVSQMLEESASLTLLVTSRERLRLHGEAVYSLAGLSYPAVFQDADRTRYDALDLLVQCARYIFPDFSLDAETLPAAVELCQLTGGMPLAIELAAAWLDALPFKEIVREIATSVSLLASRMRDLPERQGSLNAVLTSTWERLSAAERTVFMRLAVFHGGCSRQAAYAVTGAAPETLSALVGKAILRLSTGNRTSTGRPVASAGYSFHELLRQYGEQQLAISGLTEDAHTAHSGYFLHLLADHESRLKGHQQQESLNFLDGDFENIKAAWMWAVKQGDAAALDAALEGLYWLCEFRNRLADRTVLLQAALEAFAVPGGGAGLTESMETRLFGRLLARSWGAGSMAALPMRAQSDARSCLRRALALARAHGDFAEIAVVLYQRGLSAALDTQDRAAVIFFDHAHRCFAALGDDFYAAQTLLWRAFSEVDLTYFPDAEAHARAAVDLLRAVGDDVGLARALLTLGAAVENKPDMPESERCYDEAYQLLHRMGAHVDAANVGGWYLAGAALRVGDFERHRALAEELLEVAESLNLPVLKARALGSLSLAAIVDGDYERARQLAEESIPLFGDYGGAAIISVFLSYALALAGDVERSRAVLLPALGTLAKLPFLVFWFMALPAATLLLAAEGQVERAAAAMGLSLKHPANMGAWTMLVFERINLWSRLKASLGMAAFEQSFNAGAQLSPEVVFRWFIGR